MVAPSDKAPACDVPEPLDVSPSASDVEHVQAVLAEPAYKADQPTAGITDVGIVEGDVVVPRDRLGRRKSPGRPKGSKDKKPRRRRRVAPGHIPPEVRKIVLHSVQNGLFLQTAAHMAGIPNSTLHGWIRRGCDGYRPYAQFVRELRKAMAEGEAWHLQVLQQASTDGVWQASAWFLERKYPERWGRKIITELTGQHGGAVKILAGPIRPEDIHAEVNSIVDAALRGVDSAAGFEAAPRGALEDQVRAERLEDSA